MKYLFSIFQKSIFIPPWRREEEREEKQRQMETAFEQVYQENHRKRLFLNIHFFLFLIFHLFFFV